MQESFINKQYNGTMKKCIHLFLLLIVTVLLSSCSTRRSAINNLESLVERVEEKGVTYDLDEWEGVIKEYALIERALAKHEYSVEEHKAIGELKGRLLGCSTRSVILNSKEKIDKINSQIDGGVEGFIRSLLMFGQ